MIFTIAALTVAVVALIVLLDRQEARVAEERQAWQLERAGLLQRIQAPEVAVMEHNVQQLPAPSVTHAMTDVEAAEAEERARVIAELERLENEALR